MSMGEILHVPVARAGAEDWPNALHTLRDAGFETWALTPDVDAVDLWDMDVPDRVAAVLGAEGHGLEADHIQKGASVYAGKVGKQVANPLVTLVDDGTFARDWGACAIDDEGAPAQRNVLIDDGVLTDYMWDYIRARKEGRKQSGNGRRQSYADLPMVRMTNTFVTNGSENPDDIIRATDHGVYIAKLGGGQVDTASGDFVFGMVEAYLIENGEITEPLREGNLIGNGPQVLKDIDLMGNDFAMGGPGTCGKEL